MRLGVFSKTFARDDVAGVFAAVAAQGIGAVQFNWESLGQGDDTMPDGLDGTTCDAVREAAAGAGIEIAAVSGTFNIVHPDGRASGMRRLERLAGLLPRLGTRLITFCTGTRDPDYLWRNHPDNNTQAAWDDMLDAMRQAVGIAAGHGAVLVFEPEVNNIVNTAPKARRLLDEIGSEYLKVVIDGANLFGHGDLGRMRAVLDEAFELLGPDILLAHAKDLEHDGDAGHQAAGTGRLDYAYYLQCLRRVDFAGALVLHSLGEEQVPASKAHVLERMPTD